MNRQANSVAGGRLGAQVLLASMLLAAAGSPCLAADNHKGQDKRAQASGLVRMQQRAASRQPADDHRDAPAPGRPAPAPVRPTVQAPAPRPASAPGAPIMRLRAPQDTPRPQAAPRIVEHPTVVAPAPRMVPQGNAPINRLRAPEPSAPAPQHVVQPSTPAPAPQLVTRSAPSPLAQDSRGNAPINRLRAPADRNSGIQQSQTNSPPTPTVAHITTEPNAPGAPIMRLRAPDRTGSTPEVEVAGGPRGGNHWGGHDGGQDRGHDRGHESQHDSGRGSGGGGFQHDRHDGSRGDGFHGDDHRGDYRGHNYGSGGNWTHHDFDNGRGVFVDRDHHGSFDHDRDRRPDFDHHRSRYEPWHWRSHYVWAPTWYGWSYPYYGPYYGTYYCSSYRPGWSVSFSLGDHWCSSPSFYTGYSSYCGPAYNPLAYSLQYPSYGYGTPLYYGLTTPMYNYATPMYDYATPIYTSPLYVDESVQTLSPDYHAYSSTTPEQIYTNNGYLPEPPAPASASAVVFGDDATVYRSSADHGSMAWSDTAASIVNAMTNAPADQVHGVAKLYLGRTPVGAWEATLENRIDAGGATTLVCRGTTPTSGGNKPLIVVRVDQTVGAISPGQRVSVTGRLTEVSVDDDSNPGGILVLDHGAVNW